MIKKGLKCWRGLIRLTWDRPQQWTPAGIRGSSGTFSLCLCGGHECPPLWSERSLRMYSLICEIISNYMRCLHSNVTWFMSLLPQTTCGWRRSTFLPDIRSWWWSFFSFVHLNGTWRTRRWSGRKPSPNLHFFEESVEHPKNPNTIIMIIISEQ